MGIVLILASPSGMGCSPGRMSFPLALVTARQVPAGPSATHGLASVFRIEAVLHLNSTGLQNLVDANSRITSIEGKFKRFEVKEGTLVVQGDICRLEIILSERDFYETFGLVGYDPVVRIGLTTKNGSECGTVGVFQPLASNP